MENNEQKEKYHKIATDVGEKLRQDGWKGLFGIDVILEEQTGKVYLLEINARQPASTTYESTLQQRAGCKEQETNSKKQQTTISTFEAHLAALLDIDLDNAELTKIKTGLKVIKKLKPSKPGKGIRLKTAKSKLI